jgi:hypothetical protein
MQRRPPRATLLLGKELAMTIDRNDRKVLVLAALIVATLVITAAGWGVPLIGDSHRWAAALVLLLGLGAGAYSAPGLDTRSYLLGGLVLVAFLLAVVALASASLAALTLLVVSILALVGVSLAHHARAGRGRHALT